MRIRPGGRRGWLTLLVAVLSAGLVGAGVGVWLSRPASGPRGLPRATRPVPSPPPRPPVLAALPADAPAPTPAGVAAALAAAGAPPDGGEVVDAATGRQLWVDDADGLLPPASTAKLATAAAALTVLGPQRTLPTGVLLAGRTLLLVGGGDPTLAVGPGGGPPDGFGPPPARLDALAAATATALRARRLTAVSLAVDTAFYSGPATAPGWQPWYVADGDVAPVVALEVDEGRLAPGGSARTVDPAGLAGADFAALLRADRVTVTGPVGSAVAPPGAVALAAVRSPPVVDLVDEMLTVSDNDLAEALARQVAAATGYPASFTGGAAAVHAALGRLGLPVGGLAMVDASGLSALDRAAPATLAGILLAAAGRRGAALRPLLAGLPVAGFTGTLAGRFRTGPVGVAGGLVRAKTGTLTGVSALAGLVVDRAQRLLVFDFVDDRVTDTGVAEGQLDRLAAALAGCGCR